MAASRLVYPDSASATGVTRLPLPSNGQPSFQVRHDLRDRQEDRQGSCLPENTASSPGQALCSGRYAVYSIRQAAYLLWQAVFYPRHAASLGRQAAFPGQLAAS